MSNTDEEVMKIAKYIMKKERRISALNTAITQATAPIYGQELHEIVMLVIDDKLPGSIDTRKFFPDLYPKAPEKKEEKEEEE